MDNGWRARDAVILAPRFLGRALVRLYRYTLSPLIGYDCRHLPTCSHYAEEAIERFGLWAGSWMTLARLCRCHPWGTAGLDFEPEKYKHHYLKEIPERYRAAVDVRRFGPGERIVFLPYSEAVYSKTQAWLQERGLFEVKPPVNYTGSVAA